MDLYKKGQTIEVGLGEGIDDENGRSLFIFIDVDVISEDKVEELVNDDVLYIEISTEDQSVEWSKENLISELIKK